MSERLPVPTSDDAEQGVVAGVMRAPEAIHQLGFLRPSDFANPVCADVFAAVRDLVAAGKPVDWRAVAGSFEGRIEAVGKWLRALLPLAPHVLELEAIARSVRDLADRRRIIQIAEEAAEQARDGGVSAVDLAARLVGEMSREIGDGGDDMATVGALAERVVEDLPKDLPCHTTGLEGLDSVLGGGLYAGKVYGILARMKAGKTALMSTIAYNAAGAGCRVLYLPLEMGAQELTQRLLARKMGINSLAFLDRRRRRDRGFAELAAQAALELGRMPLVFQSRPRMQIDDLRQVVARAVVRDGCKGVILDYLQLVSGAAKGQSQASFLDDVTQSLAELAKRFDCWVMVAAQENQTGNVRGGEGLLNACDATLRIHRCDGPGPVGAETYAWLELMVARYVLKRNVGSETDPALVLDTRVGPHFAEVQTAAPMMAAE